MATDIPITGIVSNFRVPGGYAEIFMAQGSATVGSGERPVVFAMPLLSTGSGTAATLYDIDHEQDAIDIGGVGSPLHRACRKFLKMNNTTRLYALPVAETSTATDVAGTFAVTWTTDPGAAGSTTVRVCDQDFTYSFVASPTDTVTTIATAIKNAINNATHLPVTATNAAGVLTITAKLKGISQGNGTVDVIRVRTKIDPGVTTTVSASGAVGDTVAGAEGSTTEAANLATALATIDDRRIYFVGCQSNDQTGIDNLKTHITNKSVPKKGLRSVGIAGYTGALAGAQTIANYLNDERMQLVWQEASDHDTAELVAAIAAIRAKHEPTDYTYNMASYRNGGGKNWSINPAYLTSDYPSADDQNDAINDGITCIASDEAGSYVVMSVNTRSKDSSGTYDDFRATETHRLSECDGFTDEVLAEWALNYAGKKLADDELLADGTFNPNQKQIPGVIRPRQHLRPWLANKIVSHEGLGHLQDTAASLDSLTVIKSKTNSSRASALVELHVIDHAHQFTMRVNETSTG